MARLELTRPIAIVTSCSRRIGIGAAICRALGADGHDILFTHWQPYDGSAGVGLDPHGPEALLDELKAAGIRAEALRRPRPAGCRQPGARCHDRAPRAAAGAGQQRRPLDQRRLAAARRGDARRPLRRQCPRETATTSTGFTHPLERRPRRQNHQPHLWARPRLPNARRARLCRVEDPIEAFTVSLGAGVAPLGITVNAVNPGPTDTGWMTPELKSALMPKFPFGRIEPAGRRCPPGRLSRQRCRRLGDRSDHHPLGRCGFLRD